MYTLALSGWGKFVPIALALERIWDLNGVVAVKEG